MWVEKERDKIPIRAFCGTRGYEPARHTSGYIATWLVMALLVLAGSSCRSQKAAKVKPAQKDVIAVVNGREIDRPVFEKFLRLKEIQVDDQLASVPRQQLFREFLEDQLLLEAAGQAGTQVTDQELEDEFGAAMKQDPSLAARRDELKNLLLVQKFVHKKMEKSPALDTPQMEQYYRDHQGDFLVDDQVHVLEILVPDEVEAQGLRKKLRRGDFRTFRQLARQSSKGQTAENGGDLGTFQTGELPEEFEKVIFKLKPGHISPVFRSQHGFHIFMLEEFIPRHPQSFREAESAIFERMLAEQERTAINAYLAELFKSASIRILDPNLQFDWRQSNAKGE